MVRHSIGTAVARMAGAALLAAWTAVPLFGQTVPINELRPLAPGGSVQIEVVQHSIAVEVWNRNEVEVTGEYDSAFERLEVTANAGSFSLEIDRANTRGNGNRGGGTLTVRIPAGVALDVESVSGGVRATGNTSAAFLESVTGSVQYTGDAPEVRLNSISGSVTYAGTAAEARIESVSGSVRVEGNVQSLNAESVSGGVSVISGTPVRELDLETVSGSVTFDGSLAPGGEISVESFSGRVELTLDPATSARFELETLSGSIRVALPGVPSDVAQRGRFGVSQTANFTSGSGNGSIEAYTLSGSIEVRAR